jgi:hypothetical protein
MFVAADQAVPAEDEAGAVRGYSHRVPAPRTEPLQARPSSLPCQLRDKWTFCLLCEGELKPAS